MSGTDAIVERILTSYDSITVVGASRAPAKAAHYVADRCLIIEQRRLGLEAPQVR